MRMPSMKNREKQIIQGAKGLMGEAIRRPCWVWADGITNHLDQRQQVSKHL